MVEFDIEQYKTEAAIIRETLAQVEKDFSMFGLDTGFSGSTNLAYQEMFIQLSAHIRRLLENDLSRLYSLLYQIDLGEQSVIDAQILHPDWSLADVITELVIHRELKKVLLRKYFKNQKSQG